MRPTSCPFAGYRMLISGRRQFTPGPVPCGSDSGVDPTNSAPGIQTGNMSVALLRPVPLRPATLRLTPEVPEPPRMPVHEKGMCTPPHWSSQSDTLLGWASQLGSVGSTPVSFSHCFLKSFALIDVGMLTAHGIGSI